MLQKHIATMLFSLLCCATVSPFGSALADERIDAELSQIITQLKNKDPLVRLEAMNAIRTNYRERAQAAVPALLELIKGDTFENDHLQVCNALSRIGPASAPAVLELLRADNATWRERAAITLFHVSRNRRTPLSAVPDLITAARDKEKPVRSWSIRALGEIGPETKDVIPAIASALNDEDAAVRHAAGRALAKLGPAAKSASPLLIDLLQHDDVTTRGSAVYALGRIGPDAHAATGELIPLLKDELLREAASVALDRIGVTGPHVAALMELLNHDEVRTRQLATLNLARVGPDAKPAVASLVESLQDRQTREFAIHALGKIGADAKIAVPDLIKLLANDSYFIRAGVAEALGDIGPAARESVSALEKVRHDENRLVQRHASAALKRIIDP
jgi:HEAT repeat protein